MRFDIMEALYAAGETGMTRGDICSRFDITGAALDEIIDIVSTLADRESGARIICERHGECIILTGDAGRVLPLRLSAAEGAVLNHELESMGIDSSGSRAYPTRPPTRETRLQPARRRYRCPRIALATAELRDSRRRSMPHHLPFDGRHTAA